MSRHKYGISILTLKRLKDALMEVLDKHPDLERGKFATLTLYDEKKQAIITTPAIEVSYYTDDMCGACDHHRTRHSFSAACIADDCKCSTFVDRADRKRHDITKPKTPIVTKATRHRARRFGHK